MMKTALGTPPAFRVSTPVRDMVGAW